MVTDGRSNRGHLLNTGVAFGHGLEFNIQKVHTQSSKRLISYIHFVNNIYIGILIIYACHSI